MFARPHAFALLLVPLLGVAMTPPPTLAPPCAVNGVPGRVGVGVTTHGSSAVWRPNTSGHTATFTVRNTGDCNDTYHFSYTASGPISGVTLNKTSALVAPGGTTTVIATYNVGSPATGVLTLRADGTTTTFSDPGSASGSASYTVIVPPVFVTPDGAAAPSRVPGNVGYSGTFLVENVSGAQDTYTLTCTGSANITCGTVTPPNVTLDHNGQQNVTVGYSTGAEGIGSLTLRAASASGSDVGWYTVPVLITPNLLVDVTPDYQSVEVEKQQSHTQSFTVRNEGNRQETLNLTRACTGAAITSGCTPASESLTLGAGQASNVSIQVTASSTAGATGHLKLVTALASSPGVRDSGTVDVLVTPEAPAGTVVASVNPGLTVERDLCLSVAVGAAAAYECADLRLVHAMPAVLTMSKARVPTLLYNSNQAHPFVRLAAQVTLPNDGQIPDSVTARLLFSGVQQTRGEWGGSNWLAGSTRRIVLSFDASSKATGLYAYDLEVTRWYPSAPQNQTVQGELVIVNRQASPFGAGWWLGGLEQLVHLSSARKLWIGGDGSARVFDSVAVNLWMSPNVDHPEQLEFDGTNYCRRLPHRGCVLFDQAGRHFQTKNRLADVHAWAHRTWFDYDGSNRLSAIRLPVTGGFRTYTFMYDGASKLDSVIAPPVGTTPRATQVTVTGGQLVSLRDPDGTSIGFAYDPGVANRIVSRTDRRNTVTNYVYGSANTLAQATINLDGGATIVTTFAPLEAKGLAGSSAVAPANAFTKLDGPRTDVADTTLFWLDRFGAPSKIRNAVGNETVLTRADPTFPALVTEVRSPNGRVVRAAYDTRGNVLSSRDLNVYGDGQDAVTSYTWDANWDLVTSVTAPTGEVTLFKYDSLTGNRQWQYPGTDPARKVSFFYNDLLLLRATLLPGTPAPRDSIHYDSLGNVRFVRSPLGATTYSYKDNIGRDTLIASPLHLSSPKQVFQKLVYDIAGGDTLTITWSDSVVWSGPIDSAIVRKHYDAEGNADSVLTQSRPDRNNIGWVKRAFTFDRANRQTAEILVGFNTIPFTYDPAGNLTNGGRQGGGGVSVAYDALNRPIRRGAATFTYDGMGNVLTANNPDARITRTYNKNGTVRADTLRLSTVNAQNGTFTSHVYGQRFGYDLSGRRIWAKHPAQLAPSANADSMAYSYELVFGQLSTLRDVFGNQYRFTYDSLGRPRRITRLTQGPDSVYEARSHDLDSRLVNRTVHSGGNVVRYDNVGYDGRDKVTGASTSEGGGSWRYAPLGPVVMADAPNVEQFQWDALGNRVGMQAVGLDEFYAYEAASGRLRRTWRYSANGGDTTRYFYNPTGAAGYVEYERHSYPTGIPDPPPEYDRSWTYNSYDAEHRLISSLYGHDSVYIDTQQPPYYRDYRSEETYRYDALGRRVYTRVIRGADCEEVHPASGCRSTLTRTIWDGSQILYEIRIPGDSSQGGALENDTPSPQTHYGRVGYLHAGGIDQPLALWKGTQLVLPHANFRGVFVQGTCPSTVCTGVWFPGRVVTTFIQRPLYPDGPPSWHGSLLESGQDASGYQYKRNRYYDPAAGQFTQEDPIGLAGGLNLYGFAGGDPVNFSDPFGLLACPKDVGGDGKTESVDDCSQEVKDAWASKHISNTSSNDTDLDGVDRRLWDAVVRGSMAMRADFGISAGREGGHSVEGRHAEGGAVDINQVNGARFGDMSDARAAQMGNRVGAEIANRLPQSGLKMLFTPGMAVRTDRPITLESMRRLIAGHRSHVHITIWP